MPVKAMRKMFLAFLQASRERAELMTDRLYLTLSRAQTVHACCDHWAQLPEEIYVCFHLNQACQTFKTVGSWDYFVNKNGFNSSSLSQLFLCQPTSLTPSDLKRVLDSHYSTHGLNKNDLISPEHKQVLYKKKDHCSELPRNTHTLFKFWEDI